MTTTETGQQAEAAAAAFLERNGCTVLERNWRTRLCEIDIVAERAGIVYFCEVKYRKSARQGSGLEYITPQKLRQMAFAAESWVHAHGWQGEYELCGIEVSGPAFRITAVARDL
ncbi:MAG TPA: YraN family protein [Candidatus Saccharimonadales bacterium]|nr:YraN family protein [Candidatus Saccharimonadales bacterium]